MSKKHRITKRLLAFALSVAMIVTFTPTAMLSYAGEDAAKAAVEEPATEPTKAAEEEVVKDEPAKEEATEVKDDVVKEEATEVKEEAPSKEDETAATKDTLVRAKVVVEKDDSEVHVPYDGKEHVFTRADVEGQYHIEFEAGNGDKMAPIDSLPEGLELNVVIRPVDKWINDEIIVTDSGRYGFFIRAEISGSAKGYYYDEKWQNNKDNRGYVYMVIDSNELTVTINGVDQEMTYDGRSHLLDMFEISCDADDYSIRDINFVSKPDSARNAGTYETGTPVMGCIENTNRNYDVTFVLGEPGTLTINPAPLTVYTNSARHIAEPGSEEMLTAHGGWVDGLVGRDADGIDLVEVVTDGCLALNQTKTVTVDNTIAKIGWGNINSNNYDISYEIGTLTVFARDEVQVVIQGNRNAKTVYDGESHSVEGWEVDGIDNPIFRDLFYKEYGYKLIKFDGTDYVEGVDVGSYPMNLTAEQFSVNTEIEAARGFTVTFVVNDGGFTIDPAPLDVVIRTKNESHPFTGEEYTMKAFTVEDANKLEEAYGYTEDDIEYIGNKEIKGTEIGLYSETLTLEQFKNSNKNYEVKFRLRNEFELVGPIGRKGEKAKEEVIKEENYTSTLEIFRPVVRVKLEGTGFTVPYDGNKHTLKVDAETNKAFFDGVEQEGSAFKVSSVENKYEVPFDENGIYLRSDIELSGTNAGIYRERDWVKRLSYDDPSVAVKFVADNDKAPMEVAIDRIPLKLVVDNVSKTYEGEGLRYYEENNMLTAHYENAKTGEVVTDGPKYRVYFAGVVEKAPPVGAFEQHYLNAEILSDSSSYEVVEIDQGIFTFNKREVTVTVKGNKKRVIVEIDKSGRICEQYVYGYKLVCDDPLYDADSWVEFINCTGDEKAPYAHGSFARSEKYMMGLDDTDKYKFDNGNSCFNVKFEVEDGYIEIIDSSNKPIQLGEIGLVAENCTYDREFHPAKLESTEVTVDEKTYSIKLNRIDYWSLDDNTMEVPKEGPVNVGSYKASIGYRGCLSIYDGDVDVTEMCRWSCNEPEYTISKRPVTVTVVGDKKIVPYDGKYHEVGGYSFNSSYELYDPYKFVESNAKEPAFQKDVGTYKYILNAEWFSDTSANFEATFEVEDGFLQIVGEDSVFDIPVKLTPVNEEYIYDGERHVLHWDFDEYNKKEDTFAAVGSDENTYTIVPSYHKRWDDGLSYIHAGVYTWQRTIYAEKVLDGSGYDVTALVTNIDDWREAVGEGTLTIKSIGASARVKDNISKTYGDPDPAKETWVEITADDNVLRDVKNRLGVYRVNGENVGKYEIRLDVLPEFLPFHPGDAQKDEEKPISAKKSAKKAAKAAKVEKQVAEVAYEAAAEKEEAAKPIATRWETVEEDLRDNVEITVEDKGTKKFFTINKADLVITADNNQKNFGEKDPTLTATVGKGLVGSETLPKNFYTIDREKGEAVRMKPKFYEIVVDAPNVDVDWERETHYFKDELIPIPLDPPISQRDYEEVKAEKEAVEAAYDRVAKSMKAARTLEAVKAEKAVETDSLLDAIKEYKEVPEEDNPPEEAGPWPGEVAEEPGVEVAFSDNYSAMSSEFNLMNYNVITKNGEFNIIGKSSGGDDPAPADDDSDDNNDNDPTPAPADNNNNDGNGVVTADNTPTTVVENPAPTTTLTDNAAPTSGNAFWALINLICMLLTALLSLIMLIRYFGKRREEDEETGEEREIKRKGLVRLASLIPAIGAIIAFILTEDMSLPMILVDKWTLMMVVILAIQVGVAILAKVKKEDAEEEAA